MRKIVMLIVAVTLTCVTQAASVDWSATGLTSYKSQAFYLFDGAKSADVLAVLGAVDETTVSTLEGMALMSGTVSTKGKASASAVNVGSATSVFALVLEGAVADGVGFKTITEDVSSMLYTPPSTPPGTFSSTLATAGTIGQMHGGGVPEPTSGLLLIIGGAMLALRRKQK